MQPPPRGMTLIETIIATFIITLLASAIGGVSFSLRSARAGSARLQVISELGGGLLAEIAALPFDDPQGGTTVLTPEAGEWNPPTDRSQFDDVDDYTVWDGSYALQDKGGTPLTYDGLKRAVQVIYVSGVGALGPSAVATDYKLITVSVIEEGAIAQTFSTLRVQGGRDVDFDG